MSKIVIIGAGISGLSIGQLLCKENEVIIFEGADRPGGLIKCDRIEGSLFHRTGGHVFNTKRADVNNWFWSFFDKEKEFIKAKRNAIVYLSANNLVPYPIENHFYLLDEPIVKEIINDLLQIASREKKVPGNFEEFLKLRFGQTLYDIYFKLYNEKIWRNDLSTIPLSWLEGKLPMPSVEEILFYNIKRLEEKDFVHSSFFYPAQNGSQFLADRLAQGLNVIYNTYVTDIRKSPGGCIVNGIHADKVIFCGNIKHIPKLLAEEVDIHEFIEPIEELDSHGTTTVFCEIEKNPYSWVYMPDKEHESHRIICTGNFSKTNNAQGKMTATIEFTDEISIEEIQANLMKIPFSPRYITHNYEKYTYPIQDRNTREMIQALKMKLSQHNFFMTGRFADWEYYNMDAAIGASLDLFKKINYTTASVNSKHAS
jgi:protoporphyrinogen oxidase